MRLPRSLFGRTAVLIGGALALFCIVAWQVTIWSAIEPAAALWVNILAQRAHDAEAARDTAAPLPPGTRFERQPPPPDTMRFHGLAFGGYVETIRRELQIELGSPDVRITRLVAPSEIWVEEAADPDLWLVLSWRVASPKAPLAAVSLLCAAALVVLGAAAFSARRLTAPLAALAGAAARVAEGGKVDIDIAAGPTEVRSLAVAFQSMSHRLTPRCFGVECIRHTVLNLVQNALEYGAPPVTVATHADGDSIILTVTDHGAGLTAMQWDEALRPFHRLNPMPNSGHTGLGLALVDRLIRSGGGTWYGRQSESKFVIEVRLPVT